MTDLSSSLMTSPVKQQPCSVGKSISDDTLNKSLIADSGDDNDGHVHSHLSTSVMSVRFGGDLSVQEHNTITTSEEETLHGLCEKSVALESLLFLVAQFKHIKKFVLHLIDDEESCQKVEEYYFKTIDVMEDVRRPLLMTVAEKATHQENALRMMSKVSWDIKDVSSQHNQYVEVLLRELQIFSIRLQNMEESGSLHLTSQSMNVLWELCAFATSLIFVEGFASSKRCSNEGRALMQLDYRQFVVKMEKLCKLKPLPYQDYVISYIKAFYIPDVELENWVKHHIEYTPKQLMSLVNSVAYSNNKTKQKLNHIINEISDKIRL